MKTKLLNDSEPAAPSGVAVQRVVRQGDRIQIGTELTTGEIWWGSVQTVVAVSKDGRPIYRPKWAKVEKWANHWRLPNKLVTQHKRRPASGSDRLRSRALS